MFAVKLVEIILQLSFFKTFRALQVKACRKLLERQRQLKRFRHYLGEIKKRAWPQIYRFFLFKIFVIHKEINNLWNLFFTLNICAHKSRPFIQANLELLNLIKNLQISTPLSFRTYTRQKTNVIRNMLKNLRIL